MKVIRRSIAIVSTLLILISSFAALAQNTFAETKKSSYEQYRADWYKDNRTLEFYLNGFEAPHQTYVDNAPPEFDETLMAWKIGSLGFEAGATYSTAQVDFYQLLLFDVLWQEYSNPTYANELEKNLKMLDLSVINELNKIDKNLTLSTPVTAQNIDKLLSQMVGINDISSAIEYKGMIQDCVGYVSDVEDLVQRLCKVQMLLNLPEETADILKDMMGSTNDVALSYALDEFSRICSGEIGEAEIVALFTSEKAASVAFKKSLETIWEKSLEGSPLAPIYAGQQIGKFVSNTFLGTDKIADSYYSMDMLCNFQRILKAQVLQYKTNYESNPTESNATKLNQSISMYLKTMNTGMDYSVRYVEAVKSGGLVNYLYSIFNEENYNKVLGQLKSMQSNISAETKFFNTDIRNWYDEEYGIPAYPIEKEPQNMTKVEFDASVLQLTKDNFAVTNRSFKTDYKLTSDLETYGDVLVEGGTLDLNGFKLTIKGNLRQTGGTIKINNGTLNVSGWYKQETEKTNSAGDIILEEVDAALKMDYLADEVTIGGDFVVRNNDTLYNNNSLQEGVMCIKGDIRQYNESDNYSRPNFYCGANHKVLLNGDGKQNVSIENGGSGFGKLEIQNSANREVVFENYIRITTLEESAEITPKNLKLKQVDLNEKKLTIKGDTEVIDGININYGELTITGNLRQTGGEVHLNKGELNVSGWYKQEAEKTNAAGDVFLEEVAAALNMSYPEDRVTIGGDFVVHNKNDRSYRNSLKEGVMCIKGDIRQYNGSAQFGGDNFACGANHKVLLNGDGKQNVSIENGGAGFGKLEIQNSANREVVFENYIRITTLEESAEITPKNLKLKEVDLNGEKLTIKGDTEVIDGININYGELTITGNLRQTSGEVYLNKGKLNVSGWYKQEAEKTNAAGDVFLEEVAVGLNMSYPEDRITIGGDFVVHNKNNDDIFNNKSSLKEGVMYIKGDIRQYNGSDGDWGDSNFACGANHKVILTGDASQTVTFEGYPKSGFNILELTKERSNYTFNPDPCWKTLIEIKQRPEAPEIPVLESKTDYSVTLNEKKGCEYSIDGKTWQASRVFLELQPATEYVFYQRYAETELAFASDASEGLKVTTNNKPRKGDLNGDGTVDIMDARRVKRVAMKADVLTPEEMKLVDLNGDGKIDIMEARKIKQAAMKEIILN